MGGQNTIDSKKKEIEMEENGREKQRKTEYERWRERGGERVRESERGEKGGGGKTRSQTNHGRNNSSEKKRSTFANVVSTQLSAQR